MKPNKAGNAQGIDVIEIFSSSKLVKQKAARNYESLRSYWKNSTGTINLRLSFRS
jgi:hypothetical protein